MKNRIWNSIRKKVMIGVLGLSLAFSGVVSGAGSLTAFAGTGVYDANGNELSQDEVNAMAMADALASAKNEAIAALQKEYDKLRIGHDNATAEQQQKIFDIMQEAKENIKKMSSLDLISSYKDTVILEMDRVYNITPTDVNGYLALADTAKMIECKYGDIVTMPFPVINYAPISATNIIITPKVSTSPDEWPFVPDLTGVTQVIPALPAYNPNVPIESMRQELVFLFQVRNDVKTGYYKLDFDVIYTYDNAKVTSTISTFIRVNGQKAYGTLDNQKEDEKEADKNKSKPRIIVTGFTTTPERINAGDTFTVSIYVQNTSETDTVKNVLFDLQAAQESTSATSTTTISAFLPTSGASSIYAGSISPQSSIVLDMEMTARADLTQKPYVLNINMKYDTANAVDLSDTASVSIPIYQESRCEYGDAEVLPASINVGEQSNVTFSVFNTGKTTLNNVWVKFKGDSITGGDTYLGNINSGGTGNVDAMLTGLAPTMDDGTIIAEISYENESGEVTTLEKTITLFVTGDYSEGLDGDYFNIDDGYIGDDTGFDDGSSGKKFPLIPVIAGGAAAVVVAGAVIARTIIVRGKRKKELAELEDEDVTL